MKFINRDKYYNLKGVYIIKNILNNKVYVGSTFKKFNNRFLSHKSRLNRNVHHSPHLQNAYNKYGSKNFEFIIIDILEDNEQICKREEYWINFYNSVLDGYNVTSLVEGKRFKKHTEETKKKMSKSREVKVCKYDLSGNYIKTYDSLKSTRKDGFNPKSVSECCCGRNSSHKNFRWRYYSDNRKNKLPYLNNYLKQTVQDLETNKIYQTMKEAALDIKVSPSTIRMWVLKNYRFKKLN